LLYFTENALTETELCIGVLSGRKFCVQSLMYTEI